MGGATWSLLPSVMALVVALLVIMLVSRALAVTADTLADRTGLGVWVRR